MSSKGSCAGDHNGGAEPCAGSVLYRVQQLRPLCAMLTRHDRKARRHVPPLREGTACGGRTRTMLKVYLAGRSQWAVLPDRVSRFRKFTAIHLTLALGSKKAKTRRCQSVAARSRSEELHTFLRSYWGRWAWVFVASVQRRPRGVQQRQRRCGWESEGHPQQAF